MVEGQAFSICGKFDTFICINESINAFQWPTEKLTSEKRNVEKNLCVQEEQAVQPKSQ